MDVRYSPDQNGFKSLTTDELRKSFLIDSLFVENKIPLVYSDIDRSITGSAVPVGKTLKLKATNQKSTLKHLVKNIGMVLNRDYSLFYQHKMKAADGGVPTLMQ